MSPKIYSHVFTLILSFLVFNISVLFGQNECELQILNNLSGTPIDFYINGVKIADNLSPVKASPKVLQNCEGIYTFKVTNYQDENDIISEFQSSLDRGSNLISINRNKTNDTQTLITNMPNLIFPDTSSMFNIINLYEKEAALNVVLKDANMIAGNLGYGKKSDNIILTSREFYLDIKNQEFNLLKTVRLSLFGLEKKKLNLIIVENQVSHEMEIMKLGADGNITYLESTPLATVQYINATNLTLDVFKNGTRFSDNTLVGNAMPFKNIPAGLPMNIAMSPADNTSPDIPNEKFASKLNTFLNGKLYHAISVGSYTESENTIDMIFIDDARIWSSDSLRTDVRIFNSLGQNIKLQMLSQNVEDISKYNFNAYSSFLSSEELKLKIEVDNQEYFQNINLQSYKGKAIIITILNIEDKLNLSVIQSDGLSSKQSLLTNLVESNIESPLFYPSVISTEDINYSFKEGNNIRVFSLNGLIKMVNPDSNKEGIIANRIFEKGLNIISILKDNRVITTQKIFKN